MSLNPRLILEIQKFYLFSCISFCCFFATNARIYTNFFCHFFATNARICTNFFLSFLCHECTNLHEFLFVISLSFLCHECTNLHEFLFIISLPRMHEFTRISFCYFFATNARIYTNFFLLFLCHECTNDH
jgi:hypothetical protein